MWYIPAIEYCPFLKSGEILAHDATRQNLTYTEWNNPATKGQKLHDPTYIKYQVARVVIVTGTECAGAEGRGLGLVVLNRDRAPVLQGERSSAGGWWWWSHKTRTVLTPLRESLFEMTVNPTLCVCACCCFSRVPLFATLRTLASQASLCMGFSGGEHWGGLLCPPPGGLPSPRSKISLHLLYCRYVLYHSHHLRCTLAEFLNNYFLKTWCSLMATTFLE